MLFFYLSESTGHQRSCLHYAIAQSQAVISKSWLIVSHSQMWQWEETWWNFSSSATLRFCNFCFKSGDYGWRPRALSHFLSTVHTKILQICVFLTACSSSQCCSQTQWMTTISRVIIRYESDSGALKYFRILGILRKTRKTSISALDNPA